MKASSAPLPATFAEDLHRRPGRLLAAAERRELDAFGRQQREHHDRLRVRQSNGLARAVGQPRELVIRARDLADPRGRDVVDLTAEVIAELAD